MVLNMRKSKSRRKIVAHNQTKSICLKKPEAKDFSGSADKDFTYTLLKQAVEGLWVGNSMPQEEVNKRVNMVFATMEGIRPQDEVEGMLAAQMLATHNATMECFRRSMLPEQAFEGRQASLSQANKLTRSYATLMDTLTRYRNKGASEQKVTVQHVHVHDGGQAIVGDVKK